MTQICPTCRRPYDVAQTPVGYNLGDTVSVRNDLINIYPPLRAGTVGVVDAYSSGADGASKILVRFDLPLKDYYNVTYTRDDGRRFIVMFLYPHEIKII